MDQILYLLLKLGVKILGRVQGLDNYNVHSLIWAKNPCQRRGQGGVASLVEREFKKYVSIIKDDEHKC